MDNEKIVAVLWCFVGVAIVCFFAAVVSAHAEDKQWSYVQTPPVTTTNVRLVGH